MNVLGGELAAFGADQDGVDRLGIALGEKQAGPPEAGSGMPAEIPTTSA